MTRIPKENVMSEEETTPSPDTPKARAHRWGRYDGLTSEVSSGPERPNGPGWFPLDGQGERLSVRVRDEGIDIKRPALGPLAEQTKTNEFGHTPEQVMAIRLLQSMHESDYLVACAYLADHPLPEARASQPSPDTGETR